MWFNKKEKKRLFDLMEEANSLSIEALGELKGLRTDVVSGVVDIETSIDNAVDDISSKIDSIEFDFDFDFDDEDPGSQDNPDNQDPTDEEPVEEDLDWVGWMDKPMSEWPSHVYGQKVGYVWIKGEKVILCSPDKANVLLPYENEGWSNDPNNTDAKRIIVEEPKCMMIYANGTAYAEIPNKEIRPFSFDGGALGYLVMKEQRAGGYDLKEKEGLNAALYLRDEDVGVPFFAVDQL